MMSTNFYDISGNHTGKRSAAGLYCFSCHITLCADGKDAIHYDGHEWYESCPQCGETNGSIVHPTCSFIWAVSPEEFGVQCSINPDKIMVRDEFGRVYTGEQFIEELRCCQIQYTHSIGIEFS